jgi:hypothetical protein
MDLVERLQTFFPDWCPIQQLAMAAQDETLDIHTRLTCAERVASYLYPKPKPADSGETQRRSDAAAWIDMLAGKMREEEAARGVPALELSKFPPEGGRGEKHPSALYS